MLNGKLQRMTYYVGLYYRILKRIFGARMAARFSNGATPYLNFVVFALTWRCNLRCEMCFLYGQSGAKKKFSQSSLHKEEMSLDEWKKVVDDIAPFNPIIHLFGGEPFMYENSIELIKYIKSRGLRSQITTNGTLLKDKYEAIVESGLDEMWISLDGPEEINNRIRGVNSYRKILDGIASINNLKTKMKVRTPIMRIICTISDMNYLHLEELIHSLEPYNIYSILFAHVRFINKHLADKHNSVFQVKFQTGSPAWFSYIMDVNKMDVNRLVEEINKLKTNHYNTLIDFETHFSSPEIKEYYTNFDFSFRKRCIAPWLTAVVSPEGNVSPCPGYTVGNIRTACFKEIWNGEKCMQFRRTLSEVKKFPACDRCLSIHKYEYKTMLKQLFQGINSFLRN